MDPSHLELLKQFIGLLKEQPQIVHEPNLKFFKDYLMSLNADLPESSKPSTQQSKTSESQPQTHSADAKENEGKVQSDASDEDSEEVEAPNLDLSYVIKEDEYESVELPDIGVDNFEVSEEMADNSNEHRTLGMTALSDGKLEEALKHLTEAVKCNPRVAPTLAKRASILCKLYRPSAAVKDCQRALLINPDSAQALMWKGRAHMLLGEFNEAQKNFSQSAKIDSNETLEEWMKLNKPNADKLRDYELALSRKKTEREIKERKRRIQKAREENERATREAAKAGLGGENEEEFSPNFGAGPGGPPGGTAFSEVFNDPEIIMAMQDPEVMNAFMDVQKNPNNLSKYEKNPKVKKVMEKLAAKFGSGDM